jgi:post-segregation antitoxin (ccd killing protein)
MTDNRARIQIDQPGKPGLFQHQELQGWEVLGPVTRGTSDTGALVRNISTGSYAQANNGVIRTLDQRKVRAAIAPAAKKLEGGKRVNVYLDDDSLDRAARLGKGNVSEGIRVALEQATIKDT